MTEEEWLKGNRPKAMLEGLHGVSDRKLWLYGCACCRALWPTLSSDSGRRAVEVSERYANGLASNEERLQAQAELEKEWFADPALADNLSISAAWVLIGGNGRVAAMACSAQARRVVRGPGMARTQANLLRCIFGNLFRSTAMQPQWQTSAVASLALAAAQERLLPTGHLDPARLAVLSDALEEAGCTDADLLDHLRSPGPHVRGCWALDLILGKE